MGIDYTIDFSCDPKKNIGSAQILELLKSRQRAHEVIKLYRDEDDYRPESEIGYEVTRRTPDGEEETTLMIASEVLEEVAVLNEWADVCLNNCPANITGKPYGCIGHINYPISNKGEVWLLEQLPSVADPVLFLMLIRGIQEIGYSGVEARQLRDQVGIYFQNPDTLARRYSELDVTTDILFEMTFQLGDIQPPHAAMLLLFYGAISRQDLDPTTIMGLTKQEISADKFLEEFPFLQEIQSGDDSSIRDLKQFLKALYTAYVLNVPLLLDI